MQHGGWMAEPRRGADHLNEDAPAGPHADVRTSQPVATSRSDQASGVAVGRRARIQRAAPRQTRDHPDSEPTLAMTLAFSDGTAARLAEQPLQEQPSGAAVARMITADDITSSELVCALGRGGPTGSGRQGTQSLNSRLVIER